MDSGEPERRRRERQWHRQRPELALAPRTCHSRSRLWTLLSLHTWGRPACDHTFIAQTHTAPPLSRSRIAGGEGRVLSPFLVRCAAGRAKASPFCLGFAPCRCARDVCEIARPRCRWWAACMHGRGAHSTMHCFALSRRTSTDPLSCSASALPPLPGCAPPAHKQSHSVRAAAGRAPYPRSAG